MVVYESEARPGCEVSENGGEPSVGAAPFTVTLPHSIREYEVEVDPERPAGRVCSLTGDYFEQEESPAFR